MRKQEILIVDDSEDILALIKRFLKKENYSIITALSAEDALPIIDKKKLDLVIMDIRMGGMSGLDALAEIKKRTPKLPLIIMTAYGDIQTAIEAMKRGAYDYITKPIKKEEFRALVKKGIEASRLMKEAVSYCTKKEELTDGVYIIGNSPEMLEIYKTIGKVAESNATVLIRGESGTGKELVARAIYQHSLRKDKSFLAVNCAAIPESLFESELFGHEKGAFTGAVNKRIGKFQQCDGGTIFLDEIGDMPLSTQTKILRVLQEHTFQPVGSVKNVKVNIRIIVSTNKDLLRAIEKGEFREDLYYRLKVVTIFMPPLRQREEDIPLLAKYFIKKFNREFNKNIKKVSPEVMEYLKKYRWPGNVRELENTIQTALVMSRKDILVLDDFPLFTKRVAAMKIEIPKSAKNYEEIFQDIFGPILKDSIAFTDGKLYKHLLNGLEKTLIETVLNEVARNRTKAARILGISRNTLKTRIRKYGLE